MRPRVATVRLGDDRPADPPATQPDKFAGLVPGRYVLSVSTIQVRKNYDLLYALPDGRGAWARAPFSR